VRWSPNRATLPVTHASSPKGYPRRTQFRIAFNSVSVWGSFTQGSHAVGSTGSSGKASHRHAVGSVWIRAHAEINFDCLTAQSQSPDRCQFDNTASAWLLFKNEVQDGHEMALGATEILMQVARLARIGFQGTLDEGQGVLEVPRQFGRDHVILERLRGQGLAPPLALASHFPAVVQFFSGVPGSLPLLR
jgi:hypothetical protein